MEEESKNLKILVTGGSGFIGSILVPMLLERGYFVRVIDNLMYHQFTLAPCFLNERFEFLMGDIRDEKLMAQALKDVDYIIHLAAIVGEPACRKDPQLCYAVNLEGTALLNRLRGQEQKIIFSSTGSVYGKVEGTCAESLSPNSLSSEYSISKFKAEELIREKGNYVIYRFATGFGLSPHFRLDLLINDFVYQAIKNKLIVVFQGNFKRSFIHVRDMAESFVFALEHFQNMRNEIYNVGSEKLNITKKEIALKIQEKIDYYLHFADFAKDPEKRDYDVSYAKIREKGFETSIDLDRGIGELIKGYHSINFAKPFSNG